MKALLIAAAVLAGTPQVVDSDILGLGEQRTRLWGIDALELDTAREATSEEVKGLRREAVELKEVVAELMLENRLLKKSMTGDGGDDLLGIPGTDQEPL